MKFRDDGEVQAMVADVAARFTGDDDQNRGFLEMVRGGISFPIEALVVGETVEVQSVRYDGNPRRGLIAVVRRRGRSHEVSLADVWLDRSRHESRILAAYRTWAMSPPPPPIQPEPASDALFSVWEDVRSGETLEFIVISARQEAARVRVPRTGEVIILKTRSAPEMIPGEFLTVRPRKSGTWHQQRVLSGDVVARRLDVSALELSPLKLRDRGLWDPLDEYRGAPGLPILPYYVPIIQVGPRPSFEMENPLAGRVNDADAILQAIQRHDEGDENDARHVLMDLLAVDLRALDAHAWLGNFRFRDDPKKALAHWRVGLAIGELSATPRFAGVLPWSFPGNRPFLRCLFGCGLALWRLGQEDAATRIFDRLLWLNPGDAQGARHLLSRVRDGRAWNGERAEVA